MRDKTKSDYDIFRLSDSRLFGHDKDPMVGTEIISLLTVEGHNCRENLVIDTISLLLGLCLSPEMFKKNDVSESQLCFCLRQRSTPKSELF